MRNLLLLLLLANILFFIWGKTSEPSVEPGATIIDVSDVGPPLALTDVRTLRQRTPDPQPVTSSTSSTPDPQPPTSPSTPDPRPVSSSTLTAVIGRACVSIGPFSNTAEAERVLQDYVREGMQGSIRSTQGELFVGHWVQIRNIPNREIGDAMLKRLVAGGLGDAYLLPSAEDGLKISLGLFGDMSRAERVELQAESLNLPAEITPRMRDATVFFVDLALPPGRGAARMVERYGEEKVLLRERASCPAAT